MSQKTNTNTANTYNANGMAAYNNLIPQLSSSLSQLSQSPLNNGFFQNQLAMQQRSASQIGQRNIQNTLANTRTSGGGIGTGAAGFRTASLNNAMLSNSGMQSGAFNSSLTNALQNRNFALQSMENFNPLQTGSQTQQYKSGLGTWLPQVAGAALGAATGGLAGPAFAAARSAGQISQAADTSNNPFLTQSPTVNAGVQATPSTWNF